MRALAGEEVDVREFIALHHEPIEDALLLRDSGGVNRTVVAKADAEPR